jgi:hypothetical protein
MDYESRLIVGISPIAGWGLFSNEFIKKDSLIGEYKGELITDEIVNKRDKFREYENCTYMFKLDDEYTIDSRKMGNLLRYANHSKVNSNSYTKIVFSEGQRKIVLIAKRDIFKGEEILFDYDGQGILGKQFSWINDEKKIQKVENNGIKNNNKNNNLLKKDQNKKSNNIVAIKSTNTVINIEDLDESNNDNDNNNINDNKNKIIINSCFNNIINNNINIINNNVVDSNNQQKINENNINNDNKESKVDKILIENDNESNSNSNNKGKINEKEIKEISNINKIIKPIFEIPLIEKNSNDKENTEKKYDNINNNNPKNNLIDILSEGNFNLKSSNNKNANNNQKIIFKTEEDDIMTLRNKFKKGNETNVFDWMCKIGENLDRNRLLNKKRNPQNPIENKIQTKLNFNINYNDSENSNKIKINNINNNNTTKNVFTNTEKRNELNFEINNSKLENILKLRKPVFANDNGEDSNKIERRKENKVNRTILPIN